METVLLTAAFLLVATFAIAILFAAASTVWNLAGMNNDLHDIKRISKNSYRKIISMFGNQVSNQ